MSSKKKKNDKPIISKEERELFLSAFYQGEISNADSPQDEECSPGTSKEESGLSEDDKRLFVEALKGPMIVKDYEDAINKPRAALRRAMVKKNSIDAGIDLHGLTIEEAVARTLRFIGDQREKDSRQVLIVHGKGTGAIKQAVYAIIDSHGEVAEFKRAPPKLGGDGAVLIWLRRKKP